MRRCRAAPSAAGGRDGRRHRDTARAGDRCAPGRCRRAEPVARGRRGCSAWSNHSDCCSTPVMFRRDRGSVWGAHVTSIGQDVLLVEPAEVGDVEGMGEEVALRVAEVRPVEPDVALVEDAVEGHPPPPPVRRGRRRESGAVHERPVARGELRGVLPVPGSTGPTSVHRRPLVGRCRRSRARCRCAGSRRRPRRRPTGQAAPSAVEPMPSAIPAVVSTHVRHRWPPVRSNDRRTPRIGLGLAPGEAGGSRARHRARSPPASRCSPACPATRTP